MNTHTTQLPQAPC